MAPSPRPASVLRALLRVFAQEDINFLLTNRIPRRQLTLFMGWFSRIEQPLVRRLSIRLFRLFCAVDLADARDTPFRSLHACFTRALKPGARRFDPDPDVIASPCDAIIGECGPIRDGQLFQAKGFPYTLRDLLLDTPLATQYQHGSYATLRITAGMYHRFHAPADLRVERVDYISGDTWNVNPIALKRVEKLFCRNERALVHCRLEPSGEPLLLVPVAAVLVASIRLHCLGGSLHLRHRGRNRFECDARYAKGEEMGWFEHGSTILVFSPDAACFSVTPPTSSVIHAGSALGRFRRLGPSISGSVRDTDPE